MNMKRILLILIGFIPLALGFLMNYWIMKYQDSLLPFKLIGIVFLILWGFIGYLTCEFEETAAKSSKIIHSVAFIMLLIFVFQNSILGRFWFNIIGAIPQFYYLPLLNISSFIQSLILFMFRTHITSLDIIISFFLMIASYRLGSKFKFLD